MARGFGCSVLIQRPAVHRSYEGLPLVLREIAPAEPAANVLMMWSRECG
ncbi:hypothetical protein [Saccharopolyspora griseoalba]|uniref:Uncharacterized protein n=1 Tax=Saccharopolyspora griseoalba TaxID=1431848 RepID=A0ABW2LQI5_9PSEU